MTDRGRATRLRSMQTDCDRRLMLVTCWGLLLAWLFFGSLALAEQLNLMMETSAQDEQALSELASGLKPDVLTVEGRLGGAVTVAASTGPSLLVTATVDQVPWMTVPDLPALRLHQRVSVYRI